MRDLPILFSAPMVRAILKRHKTMTRRAAKDLEFHGCLTGDCPHDYSYECDAALAEICPYGQVGDRLWVREAWRVPAGLDHLSGKEIDDKRIAAGEAEPVCPIEYVADGLRREPTWWLYFDDNNEAIKPGRYRHARFMPRWAARTVLEITDIRVEHLQSISTPDAIAEGVMTLSDMTGEPRSRFRQLWSQLNGPEDWEANPWVRVIEFKLLEVA